VQLKLRTRLSLSYVLLALFLVALISLLTNVFLERQFKDYIIKQQNARNIELVNLISQQYDKKENLWNNSTIENIGINALEQGLIIKVINSEGGAVWDATVHNNGLCTQMINHMAYNMTSRYPDFKGSYMVQKYPMQQDETLIGSVEIGYYGPFFFSDNDLAFINTLNKLLAAAGLFSLLLALILGTVTARRISRPISKAIESAREIGRGHYKNRIADDSKTVEIAELASTINDLANSLEKQEQLRKRLTADVAHELRTPLATLQSHVEAMIDGVWEPNAARLGSCHEEILRISRMVGDLEKLAQYESENLILRKEKFDLMELAGQLLQNFQAEFMRKNIEVSLRGETSWVLADRDKISQVIINLLSNALKYAPEGRQVNIQVGQEENRVILKVKDTGIGIAPEDLPHVFERFYRADRSRTRETGGSGVGLAIVKAIVNAHGGSVSVQSFPDEATTFTVALPSGPINN